MNYENINEIKFASFENSKIPVLSMFVGGKDKETATPRATDAFTTGSVGSYDGWQQTADMIRNDGFDF